MTTPAPAYFLPHDPDGSGGSAGEAFTPTELAKGPWGPTISGNFVGGLLGRAAERLVDPELQPARLTVDLLRPVALAPLRVQADVVREGRRLVLVETAVTQEDAVVSRASALFLRRGSQPPGDVWSTPVDMPPLPADAGDVPTDASMMVWAYGRDQAVAGRSFDLTRWQHDGPKFVWLRDVKPLVDGEAMTPFTRAAMAGDVASSLTHYGTDGLYYINADYTLTLSRLPEGPEIGLAALTHSSHGGVGTGSALLFDSRGPIGSASASTLVNPGFSPRTAD